MADPERKAKTRPGRARTALIAGLGSLALLATGAVMLSRSVVDAPDLAEVEQDVGRRWPQVAQLSRSDLAGRLAASENIVLFDVREPAEYAVSHLPGAVRVDPGLSREAFLDIHSTRLAGKAVVFYCSVGVRSSLLASRVQSDLASRGVASIHNMAGGIFGWHNESRPLVDGIGATDRVHGYDKTWGRLVERKSQLQTGRP